MVKDANYRIEAAVDGLHIYNRDGHHVAADPFVLFDKLGVEKDGAHAFYRYELAKAEIARALGKRYAQGSMPLDWGVAADKKSEDLTQHAPDKGGSGRKPPARRSRMPRIVERSATTIDDEAAHALLGLIQDGDNWIIAPFRPSRTLDNLNEVPYAVALYRRRARVCRLRNRPQAVADATGGTRAGRGARRCCLPLGAGGHAGDRRRAASARSRSPVHEASNCPRERLQPCAGGGAQCAVPGATRSKMLPPDKVDAELKYLLEIAISNTAGAPATQPGRWLMKSIDRGRPAA